MCQYIDEFYHKLGVTHCDIDLGKLVSVFQTIHQDFPFSVGIPASSPFKKVAAFTVNFAAIRPVHTDLPVERFGKLSPHPNAVLAVTMSIDALQGAVIQCATRGPLTLEKRIQLSAHYWKDLIAAVSNCVPSQHSECIALIYEALAYQANPHVSYERVI